mmetsp:Transcript_2607/g.4734  ORF Transcript_2607/g.4734 Transcript_2607/m.4734 type:complete len:206 (-) Transcript_2607:134-751(-)
MRSGTKSFDDFAMGFALNMFAQDVDAVPNGGFAILDVFSDFVIVPHVHASVFEVLVLFLLFFQSCAQVFHDGLYVVVVLLAHIVVSVGLFQEFLDVGVLASLFPQLLLQRQRIRSWIQFPVPPIRLGPIVQGRTEKQHGRSPQRHPCVGPKTASAVSPTLTPAIPILWRSVAIAIVIRRRKLRIRARPSYCRSSHHLVFSLLTTN